MRFARTRTVRAPWWQPPRVGLCTSSDGGATWVVEQAGLHASHCSAVAFAGDDVLVSAAVDPFAPQGAIYRRGVDEHGPLVTVAGGLPAWLDGIADTGCIATHGSAVAVADREATSTYQPTLVAPGRVGLTVFQLRAAS